METQFLIERTAHFCCIKADLGCASAPCLIYQHAHHLFRDALTSVFRIRVYVHEVGTLACRVREGRHHGNVTYGCAACDLTAVKCQDSCLVAVQKIISAVIDEFLRIFVVVGEVVYLFEHREAALHEQLDVIVSCNSVFDHVNCIPLFKTFKKIVSQVGPHSHFGYGIDLYAFGKGL